MQMMPDSHQQAQGDVTTFLSIMLNTEKKLCKLFSTCTAGWPGDDPTTFSCCGCVVPKDTGITLLPESCPIRMNT